MSEFPALIDHLSSHALRTDGPFTLRSGVTSSWYLDARQTTFDGQGSRIVGDAVLSVLDPSIEVVGGMTMGADPIAVATALRASEEGRWIRGFSIRKEEKDHGTRGRLVGPARAGDVAAVLEDTTTTGSALVEAIEVCLAEELDVIQAVVLCDRSAGVAAARVEELGLPFRALATPELLGVE